MQKDLEGRGELLWKVLEIWRGIFFFIAHEEIKTLSPIERQKKRDKIANELLVSLNGNSMMNRLIDEIGARIVGENKMAQIVEVKAPDDNEESLRDADGFPIKYIKFPDMHIDLNEFKNCICGIRVNVCVGKSLSKLFIYIAQGNGSSGGFTNQNLFYYKNLVEKKCIEIGKKIASKYRDAIKVANEAYELGEASYDVRIYTLGTDSKGVQRLAEVRSSDQARACLVDKDAERAYIIIRGLTAGVEKLDDLPQGVQELEDRVREGSPQIFIIAEPDNLTSYGLGTENLVSGLYSQSISKDKLHLLHAGIVPTSSIELAHLPGRRIAISYAMTL